LDVSEIATKLEAVVATVPRQVITKLMLLLNGLLGNVSVAANS
jgi:hypothetical protein